jgi:ATP-dependent Zn protease
MVNNAQKNADPVGKVTFRPEGSGSISKLLLALHSRREKKMIDSEGLEYRALLLKPDTVALGGRAAEAEIYGDAGNRQFTQKRSRMQSPQEMVTLLRNVGFFGYCGFGRSPEQ